MRERMKSVQAKALEEAYQLEKELIEEKSRAKEGVSKTPTELETELRHKEQELAKLKDELLAKELQSTYGPQAASDGKRDAKSVAMIKERDAYISELKQKLADSRREITFLQKNFKEGNQEEIEKLRAQLSNKQAQNNDVKILQERLSDAQERLGLVETIIQEKETQIQNLQNELDKLRQERPTP